MSLLDPVILKKIEQQEQQMGSSLEYMKHILRVAPGAFMKFMRFMPLAAYRKELPPEAYTVARLVATQSEDCGTCVQIVVNIARQSGVAAGIIRAVVHHQPEQLSEELQDVYHFARAVAQAESTEMPPDEIDALREKLRRRWGEAALVELALAVATAKVFPTTKRVLGYAKSCSLVQIEME